jgi:hypothetical protein
VVVGVVGGGGEEEKEEKEEEGVHAFTAYRAVRKSEPRSQQKAGTLLVSAVARTTTAVGAQCIGGAGAV